MLCSNRFISVLADKDTSQVIYCVLYVTNLELVIVIMSVKYFCLVFLITVLVTKCTETFALHICIRYVNN